MASSRTVCKWVSWTSGFIRRCGRRSNLLKCDARLGLPSRGKADQEKEQTQRLDQPLSSRSRGELARVEADPGRAGTALAFSAVAAGDAIAVGVAHHVFVGVHMLCSVLDCVV